MVTSKDDVGCVAATSHFRLLHFVLILAAISFTGTLSYKGDVHTNSLQEMLSKSADSVLEEDVESAAFVDVCEMYSGFEKLSTGMNPDSEMVQLHPSAWVYVTRCRHTGRSCTGFSGSRSVCRAKKAWVQVYGRLDDSAPWQPHWIEVDSSCSCALRLFPFLPKHHIQ